MSLSDIRTKISQKTACLAVIGLGYVGLPVACEFVRSGFSVVGVDLNSERVVLINQGFSPIAGEEPGLSELVAEAVNSGRFRATCDYQELLNSDVVLIDVETPVDEHNIPRYEALRSALTSLGSILKQGQKDVLVIIESTIAPGTIQKVVSPLLADTSGRQINQGLYLGNCPERVMPGKLLANLRGLSRVVGGMNPETSETMAFLYGHIVQADLDTSDCVTAELVKTVENAYRDVQIAFANEVALICEVVGGDVWKVRSLVNKSPFRQMHLPGAGVGGHCIPKDPWLLASGVKGTDLKLRLIPAARVVNDQMPAHMADLTVRVLSEIGQEISSAKILLLGYAYLEDTADIRNSPSAHLKECLSSLGAQVIVHDPYIHEFQGDLLEKAHGCSAVILMVRHSQYRKIELEKLKIALKQPVIVDGRLFFDGVALKSAGWIYRSVGSAYDLP